VGAKAIQDLTCPSCGGPATLQEGSWLGACSACGQALLAEGDVGLPRYFVAPRAEEAAVLEALREFWGGVEKAWSLARRARVTESFLVFVPVWHVSGRVLGWVLGTEKRGKASDPSYVAVERRVSRACYTEKAACDLGELGVERVGIEDEDLRRFDDEEVERLGRIFRPLVPADEVRRTAEEAFRKQGRADAHVDTESFALLNVVNVAQSLVFYPLRVVRYEYGGRTYQATADGVKGHLLFARAPGNDLYRTARLLVGVAGGSFLLTTCVEIMSYPNEAAVIWLSALVGFVGFCVLVAGGFKAWRYGAEITLCETDSPR
jgi:hypothetical protein